MNENNLQNNPQNTQHDHSSQPIQRVMEIEVPLGDPELIARRHNESARRFPDLTLDNDEYVVVSVRRHSLGIVGIWLASFVVFVVIASLWILICFTPNSLKLANEAKSYLSITAIALMVLSVVSGMIGNSIYKSNRFIATNERVIQHLAAGMFNQKKQTINLESIEDISFTQVGIISHILNYGTIRLSTVGDESTYSFTLVRSPEKQTELLGDLVENSKENRLITDEMLALGRRLGM